MQSLAQRSVDIFVVCQEANIHWFSLSHTCLKQLTTTQMLYLPYKMILLFPWSYFETTNTEKNDQFNGWNHRYRKHRLLTYKDPAMRQHGGKSKMATQPGKGSGDHNGQSHSVHILYSGKYCLFLLIRSISLQIYALRTLNGFFHCGHLSFCLVELPSWISHVVPISMAETQAEDRMM